MTAGTDRPASDHHKKFRGQEMGADPRSILRNGKMTAFQIIVVILCTIIATLDGFDIIASGLD